LPEKQKLVIHLRDVEGYSFEEMSEVLEMDEVALRVNLSRARKKVKEEILKIVNYGIK
jgi:RNA polymerase sigma-70 factor (ECF subfamily)